MQCRCVANADGYTNANCDAHCNEYSDGYEYSDRNDDSKPYSDGDLNQYERFAHGVSASRCERYYCTTASFCAECHIYSFINDDPTCERASP